MKIQSFFFFSPALMSTETFMTSNLVYAVTYICFLGHRICQHLLNKKDLQIKKGKKKISSTADPLSSDLSSVPFLSNSQFTTRSIKLWSTVQHKASFCLCSDTHFTWCCLQMLKKYIPSVTHFAQFWKKDSKHRSWHCRHVIISSCFSESKADHRFPVPCTAEHARLPFFFLHFCHWCGSQMIIRQPCHLVMW